MEYIFPQCTKDLVISLGYETSLSTNQQEVDNDFFLKIEWIKKDTDCIFWKWKWLNFVYINYCTTPNTIDGIFLGFPAYHLILNDSYDKKVIVSHINTLKQVSETRSVNSIPELKLLK